MVALILQREASSCLPIHPAAPAPLRPLSDLLRLQVFYGSSLTASLPASAMNQHLTALDSGAVSKELLVLTDDVQLGGEQFFTGKTRRLCAIFQFGLRFPLRS